MLATGASGPALPTLMEKLEKCPVCSRKSLVRSGGTGRQHVQYRWHQHLHDNGRLVVRGTSPNTHLTLTQQLTIFTVCSLTLSKGASGVQGASLSPSVRTFCGWFLQFQ